MLLYGFQYKLLGFVFTIDVIEPVAKTRKCPLFISRMVYVPRRKGIRCSNVNESLHPVFQASPDHMDCSLYVYLTYVGRSGGIHLRGCRGMNDVFLSGDRGVDSCGVEDASIHFVYGQSVEPGSGMPFGEHQHGYQIVSGDEFADEVIPEDTIRAGYQYVHVAKFNLFMR
jgi:hypothetical protein